MLVRGGMAPLYFRIPAGLKSLFFGLLVLVFVDCSFNDLGDGVVISLLHVLFLTALKGPSNWFLFFKGGVDGVGDGDVVYFVDELLLVSHRVSSWSLNCPKFSLGVFVC